MTVARRLSIQEEPAIRKGLAVLAATQAPQGSWKGDYGGPLFLIPVFVAGLWTIGEPLDDHTRDGLIRYLSLHQNPDGGWGLDVESHSHVFTSVLNYVTLRLLGVPAEDVALMRARAWFLSRGGPLASGSWGKFILAMLGLYEYEGLDPIPPELWLVPESLPIHPSRLWCHCRMVYLPMSWLYGKRLHAPVSPLITALRTELYPQAYSEVDWARAKRTVATTDAYIRRSALLKAGNAAMAALEKKYPRGLRERALDFVLEQIRAEDEATSFICIGPINKVLNTVVAHFAEPKGPAEKAHLARLKDYLFEDEQGIRVNGYNSSELWDTAFVVQGVIATEQVEQSRTMLEHAAAFIESNQVLEDTRNYKRYFRHPSRGGWPFSTRAHGWPISDCTGEGLTASLLLSQRGLNQVPRERLAQAVELILSLQNDNGGWATYEQQRGPKWLELLNPSDVFSTIMVDVSYVECTASCLKGLSAWRAAGNHDARVDQAIEHGVKFLRSAQRTDGSFEGSWGVCFSYGTWFALTGLAAAGIPTTDPMTRKAAAFIRAHQRPDGSWSETAESCRQRKWVDGEQGHAVNTSWALLALVAAGERETEAVKRGVAWLRQRQGDDGRWPPEPIAGVFNKTCAIHYDVYLRVFPVWALALAG